MKYYLGTGTEFIKAQCKEYKTLDGALKAAAKDESLVVWDENGTVIGSLTDNVPEGALQGEEAAKETEIGEGNGEQHKEQNEPSGDMETRGNGQEEEQVANTPHEEEKGVNEANSEPEQTEAETIIPQGTMRVTVVCDGTLNLRRTASWSHGNECGRAARGQSYYVKAIHSVKGKKMVETVDGIFLSGESEHVQFEQL